jgi:hypothetical protein
MTQVKKKIPEITISKAILPLRRGFGRHAGRRARNPVQAGPELGWNGLPGLTHSTARKQRPATRQSDLSAIRVRREKAVLPTACGGTGNPCSIFGHFPYNGLGFRSTDVPERFQEGLPAAMSYEEMLIRYFSSSPGGPLPFPSAHFDGPIPAANPSEKSPVDSRITYRGYLEGIAGFVQGNRARLAAALHERGCPACADIRACDIIAEKHGSDYHPARIRLHAGGGAYSFVLNAALTARGQDRLANDFSYLRSLGETFRRKFVPRAYFSGTVPVRLTDGSFQNMEVFLGEWFEGFHEFHLSDLHPGQAPSLVLWDLDREYSVLSKAQSEDVYRQAALILTYLYDVENFREV